MSRYHLKYHNRIRRRRHLDETKAGPWVRLGLAILGPLLGVAALVLCIFLLGKDGKRPPKPSPTPLKVEATPLPTATPMPLAAYAGERQVLDLSALEGLPLLEPHITKERILFTSGGDEKSPHRLYAYDLASQRLSRLNAVCQNDQLRRPVENERYLAYLDLTREGRGDLRVKDKTTGKDTPFVNLLFDAPRLFLSGTYLAYTARTGTEGAELYLADLESRSGITLARFKGSAFGASLPDLRGDQLVYADLLSNGTEGLVQVNLTTGKRTETTLTAPVQNPKLGNGFVAYETGLLRPGLAALLPEGRILTLADWSQGFGVTEDYVVYQQEDQLFAIEPLTGMGFAVTDASEKAALLAVGDGLVFARIDDHYEIFTLEYTYGEG